MTIENTHNRGGGVIFPQADVIAICAAARRLATASYLDGARLFNVAAATVISFGWANEPMIDAYSILIQVLRSKSGSGGVFNWGNWGRPDIDALIDKAGVELDRAKRLPMMSEALMIAKREHLFIPLHNQPMAWAMRSTVAATVQASDNKPRLWLTTMK